MRISGYAKLTRSEIQDIQPIKSGLGNEDYFTHSIMIKLKDKGAPVTGYVNLSFKDGYIVNQNMNYDTGDLEVKWRKVD